MNAPASAPSFRETFERYWKIYYAKYAQGIPETHLRAADHILKCGTEEAGGSLYQCLDCNQLHYTYHQCHHRSCPQCGYQQGLDWAEKQKAKLLPDVPYSLVTFTVPEALRRVFRSNQELCYKLLFLCSSQALKEVAANPKYLGASLGMVGVLHTWTRQLEYHPHIHYIVPQGGLTPEGGWVRSKNPDFFLPVRVLSVKMRILMQEALRQADPALYESIDLSVWYEPWVVQIQAVGGGEHAVEYLARYVTRTALSQSALVADDGEKVTIRYTESKTQLTKFLVLTGLEFIRRLLQHVLPTGFRRIRTYGWLSPAAHKRLARIHALLDWKPPAILEDTSQAKALICQRCGGEVELLETWHSGRDPPFILVLALPLFKKGSDKERGQKKARSTGAKKS